MDEISGDEMAGMKCHASLVNSQFLYDQLNFIKVFLLFFSSVFQGFRCKINCRIILGTTVNSEIEMSYFFLHNNFTLPLYNGAKKLYLGELCHKTR